MSSSHSTYIGTLLTPRLQPEDFGTLQAIHIAGTKGKGSTAAFVSSILNQIRTDSGNGNAAQSIGLYTSPHLRFVRERIQINGTPLSEEVFTKYFFDTWDRYEASTLKTNEDPRSTTGKPVYFSFLTLMMLHAFKSLDVRPAIVECGIGGAYDSTNVLTTPSVTAITSLGIDHTAVLGDTIQDIAWHKAGIMKPNVTCLTPSSQPDEAKRILEQRAHETGANLRYIDTDPEILSGSLKLGLQGDFQKTNGSLAIAIVQEYLTQHPPSTSVSIPSAISKGLASTRWPGRCDIRKDPILSSDLTWAIDGGHTLESIALTASWYASQLPTLLKSNPAKPKTFLIFNQQTRSPSPLALALHKTLTSTLSSSTTSSPFTHVIFTTNTTFTNSGFSPDLQFSNVNAAEVEKLTVQNELADTWRKVDAAADVRVVRSIEEAVAFVRRAVKEENDGEDVGVEHERKGVALVTGSLHLVGGLLEVLESGQKS